MTRWDQKFIDCVSKNGPGSYVVEFPTYRPDLVEDIARESGCIHLDFRARDLAPLGFAAHNLPLSAIEAAIAQITSENGVVIQNAEALLATKQPEERSQWLGAFLETGRDYLAVVPLALFGREIADHPRLVRFLPSDLPAESLIAQLASMRLSS